MTKTSIEWTQESWNPIVGCSLATPGCTNCYAMAMAARIEAMNAEARATEWQDGKKRTTARQYDGTTHKVNGRAVWTGHVAMAPDSILLGPLKRKKPTTYFVNSMGDLFHEDVPDDWIDRVFAVMALTPQHTYQVLTKRSGRMREYITRKVDWNALLGAAFTSLQTANRIDVNEAKSLRHGISDVLPWPLPNVWLGVSTERQQEADERIPDLLATPAAIRFISAEPLLGPIDLTALKLASCTSPFDVLKHGSSYTPNAILNGVKTSKRFYHSSGQPTLDWVIVGGESGPDARPMHPTGCGLFVTSATAPV